jgi:hypothetical protein
MRKRWVRSLLCCSLSWLTLLGTTLGSAAPPHQNDDDSTVAMARERFKEGVAFFDRKEFDKARAAFLQAYALKKHPAVLLNLAQSELRSSHEADAAKHFAAYLRETKDSSEAERPTAEAGLSAAKAAVSEIDVEVDETGAEVYLDSAMEGLSPLPGALYVNPGAHAIEARRAGKTSTLQISASAGKHVHAELQLSATPLLPVKPAAQGSQLEPEPEPEPPPPSAGRRPFFKWLVTSPVGLVGLGLTGVGVLGGGGAALAANRSYTNADSFAAQIKLHAAVDAAPSQQNTASLCTDPVQWLKGVHYESSGKTPLLDQRAGEYKNACAKYTDTTKRGDTLKTVATVGFVVAGVAAVGTVIYYFLDPNAKLGHDAARADGQRLALVPLLGPTQGGLSVLGSF